VAPEHPANLLDERGVCHEINPAVPAPDE
jgi:hypothetical protein